MSASEIVNKVWNYAHVLRDDGVGYGDYVEQITYLIFLKMADEREEAGQETKVPSKSTSMSSRLFFVIPARAGIHSHKVTE